jgi:hypothetical protein
MSTFTGLQALRATREPPFPKPLDEAAWQPWATRVRVQDRRSRAARVKVVKWASMAGLLVAAGFWSHLPPYDTVIRFVLTSCAMGVMFQAFQSRRYALAVVFGALALLYNPVVPELSFQAASSAR